MIFERIKKLQSPMEKEFLYACATVGLLVEAQYKIANIHADFAIPERKLAIEIDGAEWHELGNEKDRKRNDIYAKEGWNVIRFTGSVIYHDPEEVAELVKKGVFDNATGYTIDDINEYSV